MAIRKIFKNHLELIDDAQSTYLTAALVGGTTSTLTVLSNKEFSENQVILIGEFGDEGSEIVKTHASDAMTGDTDIILVAAVEFDHAIDMPVYLVDYNQIKFAHSATATGTKAILGTEDVEADAKQTTHRDRTKDSGFYFKKYFNSITSTFTTTHADNEISDVAHGLVNGETISMTTTTTLPDGYTVGVVYYVVSKATDTFKVALTLGGTAVTITNDGTGTHTWGRCGLWSDAEPYADFNEDTVYGIKQRALDELGEEYGSWLTSDWLSERLWSARRLVHNKRKRWSWRQVFEHDLGDITTGMYRIAMPTDIKDPNTAKDVLGLRIGTNENLEYIPKREWDEYQIGVGHTTLASAYAVADGTITLTDSRDFDETGTIKIGSDSIEYSANNESTGVLTVSDAGSSAHSAAVDVWQNVTMTLPTKFTVWQEYIYFNYPIHNDYVDQNIWIDYYKVLTEYDSEGDELDEPEFDFYVNYLKWAIKHRQRQGKLEMEKDADGKLFLAGVADLINKETSGQVIRFIPDTEHLEE